MSVRQGLLALLAQEPMYGYQLRSEFEARTGATWPLNVGQVYSTLARLERDGLVETIAAEAAVEGQSESRVEGRVEGRIEVQVHYRLTDTGRDAVRLWFATPVERTAPPRDELAIKLAMAVTVPGVDVRAVVQAQRTSTLRALQDYTRLKRRTGAPDDGDDLAWSLVLDSLVFATEAEIRWLDHCEARLARASAERGTTRRTTVGGSTEEARR